MTNKELVYRLIGLKQTIGWFHVVHPYNTNNVKSFEEWYHAYSQIMLNTIDNIFLEIGLNDRETITKRNEFIVDKMNLWLEEQPKKVKEEYKHYTGVYEQQIKTLKEELSKDNVLSDSEN